MRRGPSPRGPRAPCRASGRSPAGVSAGHLDDDVRGQPDLVDPALVRRQPAGDREPERPTLAGELRPLLDGALAERLLADERGPLRVLEGAGHDLARRGAAAVDEADDPQLRVRGDAAGQGRVAIWCPFASCSQKIGPEPMNWLATERAAVTKPPGLPRRSRISAVRPAVDVRGQASRHGRRRRVGEAAQPDIADGAVGRGPCDVTSCCWMTSRVIARSNGAPAPRWIVRVTTEPFGPRIRSRAASTVRPSSGTPSVARTRSPASRPAVSAGDPSIGADDHEMAVRPERRAALASRPPPACRSRRRCPRTGR